MLVRLSIVLLCLNFAVLANSDETAPRVKTPLGALKGYYKITQNGRKYEAYEGIPYALPPIGKLRFKVREYYLRLILNLNVFAAIYISRSGIPQSETELNREIIDTDNFLH